MRSIIEFLEARIAEDEYDASRELLLGTTTVLTRMNTRVLAECAAKRELVETWYDEHGGGHVLRTLAAVYKDHPDYRKEWAV